MYFKQKFRITQLKNNNNNYYYYGNKTTRKGWCLEFVEVEVGIKIVNANGLV